MILGIGFSAYKVHLKFEHMGHKQNLKKGISNIIKMLKAVRKPSVVPHACNIES